MRNPFRRPSPAPATITRGASDPHPPMRVETVTLAHLEQIARDSGAYVAVDYTTRVAYLRRAQTRYEAPLDATP